MNLEAKLKQQPLEKVFLFMCKFLPNELISVPSNKRPKWIHKKIFERVTG